MDKKQSRGKNRHLAVLPSVAIALAMGAPCSFAASDAADGSAPTNAADDGNYLKLGGYVRTWASLNLKDHPETAADDKGSLSMLRASVSLNADAKTGPLLWKAIVRADREALTASERRLQDLVRVNTPGGPGSNMLNEYRQTELREFYVDADLSDRVHLRLGKQQVVWGETDFFHPTDLLQGYDFRWRSFLEGESDELRKPLIQANFKVNVPEANGNMQVVVRPGLDRKKDIGNQYELSGGRWMAQPFKGIDFLANLTPYDHEHPAGNYKDTTGGLRWSAIAGPVNYTLSWMKTFYPDAVLNPTPNPYQKTPTGIMGNWITPKVNVFSASLSGEIPAIDAVINGEVSFAKDRIFNTNSNGDFMGTPGLGPVAKKNVVQTTIRMDKQLRLMDILGTNQASFFSVQLFDTWIKDFKKSDDMVGQIGYGAPIKEHDTILTAFIVFNYMHSKLNPMLAAGVNLSTGDRFVIPSVSYAIGNNWRLQAELDLFLPNHQKMPGQVEKSTYGLADLANNNQLMIRATYQF